MRKNRVGFIVMAMLVAGIMALGGCATNAPSAVPTTNPATPAPTTAAATTAVQTTAAETAQASAEPQADQFAPLGKYDPPITITTIRGIEPSRSFMPGETWDNNLWTKAYEERLGIKFEYLWTCASSEFSQKVNIAIASDDLPELMHIDYDQFYRLAVAGKLADITDAFDKYASPDLKSNVETIANGVGKLMDTYQGKYYGIGTSPGYALGGNMLWFRDDWLKNVGLQKPATWDDVLAMMTAFTKNDPNKNGTPTVGMGLSKTIWDTGNSADPFFAAYGAYPTIWVKNGAKLEFGAIQPQCKDALLELQKLYKDGVIDQEFSIKGDWDNFPDDMVKDKVGCLFGPNWVGDWTVGTIMKNHPGVATWSCMEVPSKAGGVAKRAVTGKQAVVLCMNANTKHPEALVKITNFGINLMRTEGKYHDAVDDAGKTIDNFFCYNDFLGNVGDDADWNYKCAVAVTDALNTNDPSKLNPEQKNYYDGAVAYKEGKDLEMYRRIAVFGPGGSMEIWYKSFQAGNVMPDEFYGPNTDTMNAKLGNLKSKRDETFTKIIMGEDIGEFDKWVDYFNSQGGQEITAEVNDWYAKK